MVLHDAGLPGAGRANEVSAGHSCKAPLVLISSLRVLPQPHQLQ